VVKKNTELFTDAEYKRTFEVPGDDYLIRTPRPAS